MHINWSRIQQFQSCQRLYYWRFVQNLVPQKDALPLVIGKAVHAGLAAHYDEQPLQIILQARQAFQDAKATGSWLGEELSELEKQETYVHYILDMYTKHWEREPWTVLAPEVEGMVELPDSAPPDGKPHQLHFRCDGVISWRGHPWLLEHKTTAQMGGTFFKKFTLDGQITSYIYAIGKKMKIRPIGAVINAIRKSRKLDRVEFAREVVMRSEDFVTKFMSMMAALVDMIDFKSKGLEDTPSAWYMNTGQCIAWNRACDYHELCRTDRPELRELFKPRDKDYVDRGEHDSNKST